MFLFCSTFDSLAISEPTTRPYLASVADSGALPYRWSCCRPQERLQGLSKRTTDAASAGAAVEKKPGSNSGRT